MKRMSYADFDGMSDYDVFKIIQDKANPNSQMAIWALHKRYEKAIWKQKHVLDKKLEENHLTGLDTEGYIENTYDTFLNAVNSIKLPAITGKYEADLRSKKLKSGELKYTEAEIAEKIANKQQSWKFWVCLTQYLMSRNRDDINHYVKGQGKELQITTYVDDEGNDFSDTVLYNQGTDKIISETLEDAYIKSLEKKAFQIATEECQKKFNETQKKMWRFKADRNSASLVKQLTSQTTAMYNRNLAAMRSVFDEELSKASAKLGIDTPKF